MLVSRMIFAMKLYIILPLSLNKYINHVFLILKPICFYKWLLVILKKCVIQFFPLIWKIFVQSQHIFVNLVSGKTLKTPSFSNHLIFIFCDTLAIFENLSFQSIVIILPFEQVWVHECQNEAYFVCLIVCVKFNHFQYISNTIVYTWISHPHIIFHILSNINMIQFSPLNVVSI